jgi:formate dehydrogenase assembly factor FdhD
MTNTIEFKTVRTFITTHEAHLARGFLESEGIEAFVRDEFSVGIRPYMSQALGGVRLDVREEDYERARGLLDIPAAVPTPHVCPMCGGEAPPDRDGGAQAASFLVSLAAMAPILLRKTKYRCAACGNSWRS